MIEPFSTQDALTEAAVGAIVDGLTSALVARDQAHLVVTGGRSPGPIYDRLSGAVIDWSKVGVILSDDRCVSSTSPDSNERLVRARLLVDRAAQARFIPLGSELDDHLVRSMLPFDVTLLGMGEDGHVASLITAWPEVAQAMDPADNRCLVAVPEGYGTPPLARISLRLSPLLTSRLTLILIAGQAKRDLIETRAGLPVHALLKQAKGRVRVLWTPES